MEFLKLLENVDLNEQQVEALDKFFASYTEKIKTDAVSAITESSKNEDAEKELQTFKEESEKAFALLEADSEKAFELYKEDLQKEYTDNFAEALESLYNDIQDRVKKDFTESTEFKALESVKKVMLPFIENKDVAELVEKLNKLEEEKQIIEEEKEDLNKINIINALMEDIPSQFEDTVRNFIETSKSIDEVYERYQMILEMLEKGLDTSRIDNKSTLVDANASKTHKTFKRKAKVSEEAEKEEKTEESKGLKSNKSSAEGVSGKDSNAGPKDGTDVSVSGKPNGAEQTKPGVKYHVKDNGIGKESGTHTASSTEQKQPGSSYKARTTGADEIPTGGKASSSEQTKPGSTFKPRSMKMEALEELEGSEDLKPILESTSSKGEKKEERNSAFTPEEERALKRLGLI